MVPTPGPPPTPVSPSPSPSPPSSPVPVPHPMDDERLFPNPMNDVRPEPDAVSQKSLLEETRELRTVDVDLDLLCLHSPALGLFANPSAVPPSPVLAQVAGENLVDEGPQTLTTMMGIGKAHHPVRTQLASCTAELCTHASRPNSSVHTSGSSDAQSTIRAPCVDGGSSHDSLTKGALTVATLKSQTIEPLVIACAAADADEPILRKRRAPSAPTPRVNAIRIVPSIARAAFDNAIASSRLALPPCKRPHVAPSRASK